MPYFLALFERISGSEDWYDADPELESHVLGLIDEGKLVLAGKLSEDYVGVGVLQAKDKDEAESIVASNPTVGRSTDAQLFEIHHPVGTLFKDE